MNRKYLAVAGVVVGVLLVLLIMLVIGVIKDDETDMEDQPKNQNTESATLVPGESSALDAA